MSIMEIIEKRKRWPGTKTDGESNGVRDLPKDRISNIDNGIDRLLDIKMMMKK